MEESKIAIQIPDEQQIDIIDDTNGNVEDETKINIENDKSKEDSTTQHDEVQDTEKNVQQTDATDENSIANSKEDSNSNENSNSNADSNADSNKGSNEDSNAGSNEDSNADSATDQLTDAQVTKLYIESEGKRNSLMPPDSPTRDIQLGGYRPDCGTKEYKFLSMEKLKHTIGQTHPMKLRHDNLDSKGNPIPEHFPVCSTEFGAHSFYRLKTDSTVLSKYGIGMVLYFKYLKIMAWLFTLAIILSIPSMCIFILGGRTTVEDVKAIAQENPAALFGLTSIGHLGEGTSICAQVPANGTLDLACEYGEIGYIIASYSHKDRQGSCTCPALQKPNENSGKCMGEVNPESCNGGGCVQSCRDNVPCHLGTDPVEKKPCCAYNRNNGQLDFDSLKIRDQKSCRSNSIEPILKGKCMGKPDCQIHLAEEQKFRWIPNDVYGSNCPSGFESYEDDKEICELAIKDDYSFKACPKIEDRSLIVYARCFTTKIQVIDSWSFKIIDWHYIHRDSFLIAAVLFDILTCIMFLYFISWMKFKEREEARKVDSDELAAKHYTVQLMHLPAHKNVPVLGKELREHLEDVLTSKPKAYRDVGCIKIADVNFGLTNAVQIDAMRKRGVVARKLDIATQKLNKFKALQSKLSESQFDKRLARMLLTSRELDETLAKYDTWLDNWEKENTGKKLRAVTAFITFEEEEGYLRCLKEYPSLGPVHRLFQPYAKRFNKKRMNIKPAPGPTDILWENLDYPYLSRLLRNIMVNIVTAGLLMISFLLIYYTKIKKVEVEREFGRPSYCPENLSKQQVVEDQLWKRYEKKNYEVFVECYCQKLAVTKSFSEMLEEQFYNPLDNRFEEYCYSWAASFVKVQALTIGAVLVVIAINFILKTVLKTLVLKEKRHTLSEQVISIMKKIFLAQFINTAILLVLINANLNYFKTSADSKKEAGNSLLFNGRHDDFDVAWYNDVGIALMLTMVVNAIAPHIGIFANYVIMHAKRCSDRGCTFDEEITKQSTQRDLEVLYRGPSFELATRYAQSLNTVFISLLFSSGMPLLLVLGGIGIIVTYWTDKFTFLRVVRNPPQFSSIISEATGSLLPAAIILHILFGIWMYSNENIFQTNYYAREIDQPDSTMVSGNPSKSIPEIWTKTAGGAFSRIERGPAVVLMAFLFGLLTYYFIRYVVLKYLTSCIQSLCPMCVTLLDQRQPEGYPNYFDALSTKTLEEKLETEHLKPHLRKKYELALTRRGKKSSNLAKTSSKHEGKFIAGCHSYDILDNHDYIDAFAMDSQCATKRRLCGV